MKSLRHWTPRYFKNRIAEMYYHKTCPTHPWLTRAANQMLPTLLKGSDIGLEFGSGRSTLWFAQRVKHLTSVEHDEAWGKRVQVMLADKNQNNVDYSLLPKDQPEDNAGDAAYVKTLERFDPGSIDFVLVDGIYRDFCAIKVLRVIRPGGMLIIDNVNWFLPSDSRSPDSRTPAQGPKGQTWRRVYESISHWRSIWTSSGTTHTAIYFKPCRG